MQTFILMVLRLIVEHERLKIGRLFPVEFEKIGESERQGNGDVRFSLDYFGKVAGRFESDIRGHEPVGEKGACRLFLIIEIGKETAIVGIIENRFHRVSCENGLL